MHLIAPLVTGFSDAPSGSVRVYTHGTTTDATCYSDFDGTSVTTSRTLDSSGRITLYTDEIVDIVVLDADAATVATFTYAVLAEGVAIRNDLFTGEELDGSTAAGGLTTLAAAFDSLHTSLGTTDGKVLISGTASYIKDAIAAAQASVFYNVVADYDATGDGAADDTAEIQAAINAASAAGGGTVIFPEGTYLITSSLTLPSNVHLLGVGGAYIQGTSSSITKLIAPAGNNIIANLKLGCHSSDACVLMTSAITNVKIVNCTFVHRTTGVGGTGVYISGGCRGVLINGCDFTYMTFSLRNVDTVVCDGVQMVGSYCYDAPISACGAFAGNTVIGTASSATYGSLHTIPAIAGHTSIAGNKYEGLSTQMAFSLPGSTGTVAIAGNTYDVVACATSTFTSTAQILFTDLERRYFTASVGTVSYIPDFTAGRQYIDSTSATITVGSTGVGYFPGHKLEFIFKNSNAAAHAISWDTTVWSVATNAYIGSAVSVPQNGLQRFVFRYDSTVGKYVQIGGSGL